MSIRIDNVAKRIFTIAAASIIVVNNGYNVEAKNNSPIFTQAQNKIENKNPILYKLLGEDTVKSPSNTKNEEIIKYTETGVNFYFVGKVSKTSNLKDLYTTKDIVKILDCFNGVFALQLSNGEKAFSDKKNMPQMYFVLDVVTEKDGKIKYYRYIDTNYVLDISHVDLKSQGIKEINTDGGQINLQQIPITSRIPNEFNITSTAIDGYSIVKKASIEESLYTDSEVNEIKKSTDGITPLQYTKKI